MMEIETNATRAIPTLIATEEPDVSTKCTLSVCVCVCVCIENRYALNNSHTHTHPRIVGIGIPISSYCASMNSNSSWYIHIGIHLEVSKYAKSHSLY